MADQHTQDRNERRNEHADHTHWLEEHRSWRIEHAKLLAALRRVEAEPPLRASMQPEKRGPFAGLFRPGVNVLVIERTLRPAVAKALEEVARGELFELETTLDAARPDPTDLLRAISNPTALWFSSGISHSSPVATERHWNVAISTDSWPSWPTTPAASSMSTT